MIDTTMAEETIVVPPEIEIYEESGSVVADAPDSILDGVLGDICQKRLSASPLAYAWGALVTAAGALVPTTQHEEITPLTPVLLDEDNKPLVLHTKPLRTNLYYCAIGDKGSGKSQTMERVFDVLGIKYPVKLDVKVGSGEGLAEELKGTSGSHVLFPDEMSHLLEKANLDGASLAFILNTGFYQNHVKLTTKGKSVECDARLSIIGGTTTNLFPCSFGPKTSEGLYDRFLFGLSPQPFSFDYMPFDSTPETIDPVPVDVDDEVYAVRNTDWKKAGILNRVGEIALRVAYICACYDHRVLQAKDLKPAYEFAKYQMQVRTSLMPSPGERDHAKMEFAVRRYMDSVPEGKWTTRSTLFKKAHAERYGTAAFEKSMRALVLVGELERQKKGNAEVYRVKR